VVGAIALSGYAALLPVNYAGLALILLPRLHGRRGAPACFGAPASAASRLRDRAVLLIDTDVEGFGIPTWSDLALAAGTAAFVFFVSGAALKARRRPVVTGREELIGSRGVVLDDLATEGWARVHSEQWRVKSAVPLRSGQPVRVLARDGLVLTVAPLDEPGKGDLR
jgi:membrane-bound serine protease (ClpP class)